MLISDAEQLTIFFYENVLLTELQTSLLDCITVNDSNGVWDRLDARIPINSIPRAILLNLKETKPMVSNSPQEMRRVLEKIQNYARQSKEANNAANLSSHSTLDLIEQKLTDNLLRRYRRWLHHEHQNKLPTVDHLISFLQSETDLEERISNKTSHIASRKIKPIVNVIHSATQDHCLLYKVSRHKFVDCDEFKKLSP